LPFSPAVLLIQNAAAAAAQTCVRRGRVWHRDRLKRQRHMALHVFPHAPLPLMICLRTSKTVISAPRLHVNISACYPVDVLKDAPLLSHMPRVDFY